MSDEVARLLKPAEAARILNVSRPYVYKMAERGLLPCVRWPGTGDKTVVRFLQSDLLKFIETNRQGQWTEL